MSVNSEHINKDNSETMFKLLADVSKQNSDSIIKQTESITKLTEGQGSIAKTLADINITLKDVHQSDNNNPTGPGLGMNQKPKVESDKDIGDKTTAPNAYAPGEYGSTGRGGNEPANDKGGLKMENKEDKPKEEVKTDDKPKEEEKTHKEDKPKEEEKKNETHGYPDKDMKPEDKKKEDKPKEEEKQEEPKKEDKYKSFSYEDNEPLRPSIMTKQFEQYPDGYQIIKAALGGWGIEGINAEGSYVETLKRLDNREFGSFGADMTGGSYY